MSVHRILLFLLALSVASCGNNDDTGNSAAATESTTVAVSPQGEDAVTAAANFLKWYAQYYQAVAKINMVNDEYSRKPGAPEEDYRVDFTEAQRYLDSLVSSGYISGKYVAAQMAYFKKCDEYFKKEPQKGGPPQGFEADLVLMTQEIDETLAACASPKVMSQQMTGDSATVTLDVMMHLRFTLSRTNGKWLIDNIENVTTL